MFKTVSASQSREREREFGKVVSNIVNERNIALKQRNLAQQYAEALKKQWNWLYAPDVRKVVVPDAPNALFLTTMPVSDARLRECYGLSSLEFAARAGVDGKVRHRAQCLNRLAWERATPVPSFVCDILGEAVMIEFRDFPHVETVIRNTMRKIPEMTHTFVCGMKNHAMALDIQSRAPNMRVVCLGIGDTSVNDYNNLLQTVAFWDNFAHDKILLYQEDTYVFRKGVSAYLDYDWVGAPWPLSFGFGGGGVGNGGFSIRSRKVLIRCLEEAPSLDNVPAHAIAHMRVARLDKCPEDVYFATTMNQRGFGRLAPRDIAASFAQETCKSHNPFGGHCFWIAEPYRSIGPDTNLALLVTPFPLERGGGEKYLLDIGHALIGMGFAKVVVSSPAHPAGRDYLAEMIPDLVLRKKFQLVGSVQKEAHAGHYGFALTMTNSVRGRTVRPNASQHALHVQFPFDWDTSNTYAGIADESVIDVVLLNSEFTERWVTHCSRFHSIRKQVLYPCVDGALVSSGPRTDVIVIGRFFPPGPGAHCKHHDVAIEAFKVVAAPNSRLHLVGAASPEQKQWLDALQEMSKHDTRVTFHLNTSEADKLKLFARSRVVLNCTGSREDVIAHPQCSEHFGIAFVEGILAGCWPVTVDSGYPPMLAQHGIDLRTYSNTAELAMVLQTLLAASAQGLSIIDVESNARVVKDLCSQETHSIGVASCVFDSA